MNREKNMVNHLSVSQEALPAHVGIIMDGNGRWAAQRGLPRKAGHKKGSQTLREIVKHCSKIGISYLTVYAFSTENWKRPKEEVESLMQLMRDYLQEWRTASQKDPALSSVCIKVIGDMASLDEDIREAARDIEQSTSANTGMTLNIAFNYGGRSEMLHAVKELAAEITSGRLLLHAVEESDLARHLYTASQPDVDLIVRPSGEQRTSNFLIWQGAYAELVFMDVLWPDFSPAHMNKALQEYAGRNRRFGGR